MDARRGLQGLLGAIGAVAVAAGLRDALGGSAKVVGANGPVAANVDSELRFYSSWYAVFGVLALRAARRPESEPAVVQAAAGGFLLAAVSRLLSLRSHGRPHPTLLALTAVEFVIPPVVLAWQRSISR